MPAPCLLGGSVSSEANLNGGCITETVFVKGPVVPGTAHTWGKARGLASPLGLALGLGLSQDLASLMNLRGLSGGPQEPRGRGRGCRSSCAAPRQREGLPGHRQALAHGALSFTGLLQARHLSPDGYTDNRRGPGAWPLGL